MQPPPSANNSSHPLLISGGVSLRTDVHPRPQLPASEIKQTFLSTRLASLLAFWVASSWTPPSDDNIMIFTIFHRNTSHGHICDPVANYYPYCIYLGLQNMSTAKSQKSSPKINFQKWKKKKLDLCFTSSWVGNHQGTWSLAYCFQSSSLGERNNFKESWSLANYSSYRMNCLPIQWMK